MTQPNPYLRAMTDWLACAAAGSAERAAQAVRATGGDLLTDVAFAGTAGHVLDFDDTYPPGVAHVSAATAPAALVLAASLDRTLGDAVQAYARGFEAMAAVSAASHPALYDGGWHPTTVCGPVGAAVAACELLGIEGPAQRRDALALALLRAGGTRGAFGSDGKAIQVGLAAAAGVQAARLAQAGAHVDWERAIHGPLGFEQVVRAGWPPESGGPDGSDGPGERAIDGNWLKLHPSCLGTHASIDAADEARTSGFGCDGDGPLTITVNPLARQAAHLDEVADGLAAKFSIPYCVAFTLRHGPPRVADFDAGADPAVIAASRAITVFLDAAIPDWGAVLRSGERELASMPCPKGTPDRPASDAELAAKATDLAGPALLEVMADLDLPAARALAVTGLARIGSY